MTKPLWYQPPAPPRGWVELVRLAPANTTVVPQHMGLGASGDWFLTQGRDMGHAFEDLIITRFTARGKRLGTMRVPQGGHGDRLVMRGDDVGVYIRNVWCWLPWQYNRLWSIGAAQDHKATRDRLGIAARTWCQGEVDLGDTWLRLYGVPFKADGPSRNPQGVRNPDMPAFVEVIKNLKVVDKISLGHLAREPDGRPIGGRLEPEGLAVGQVDGTRHLLAGFAVGTIGDTTMIVYGRPLDEVL